MMKETKKYTTKRKAERKKNKGRDGRTYERKKETHTKKKKKKKKHCEP